MNAAGRLGLYGAGLAAAFAAAFGISSVVVPESLVADWSAGAHEGGHDDTTGAALSGLSLSANGYALSPVTAPAAVGENGELSFRILDAQGEPVVAFEAAHEKDLHLIVVRTDGAQFRHVHPELDSSTGAWSTPWSWDEAGTYRVYADFVPAGGVGVTLSRAVEVAGDFTPTPAAGPATDDRVAGFEVTVEGVLAAGSTSELTITVARDGAPVTALQPYLGALGHLVALREGDLAYLHVHARDDAPAAGETAGPEIVFAVEAPTAGRYLLYLEFQVDGQVHTAEFVLDAVAGAHEH